VSGGPAEKIPLKSGAAGGYGQDPMEFESTRLMTRTKNGDDAAFDELVVKLRGRAFAVARSFVGSHDDALELTQDAFLKTYRARATYREGEPFLPWFHRILRNTCFSFLRKHKKLRKASLSSRSDEDESDWEIDGEAPPPCAGAEHDEIVQVLRRGFEHLSARDREILALRHFQELSYKDIAVALSIPEGTVMSRLFHARRRLRDELSPHLTGALAEFAGHEPPESAPGGRSR
jgi:RNA polymerase sigma-70 factor (ECF subfamily)